MSFVEEPPAEPCVPDERVLMGETLECQSSLCCQGVAGGA